MKKLLLQLAKRSQAQPFGGFTLRCATRLDRVIGEPQEDLSAVKAVEVRFSSVVWTVVVCSGGCLLAFEINMIELGMCRKSRSTVEDMGVIRDN